MSSKSPSSKSVSSIGIFRPWQLESASDGEGREKESALSIRPHYPLVDVKLTVQEQLPSTSYTPPSDALRTCPLMRTTGGSFLSSAHRANPKRKQITVIKKERSESLSESVVSSSTSFSEDTLKSEHSSLQKPNRKGQKRRYEEFDESYPKQAKTEALNPSTFIPETSSFSGTANASSNVLQVLPPPGLSFPSSSPFLQSNSQFGPLVPLLEPPIFVPASEVERVCARRPRPKRFSCGECGAAFSNRGQLSGHCRIHTGERPFRCNQPGCGKRFTRNEELTRHRRIHSGLRPFACGICPKRFGRKDHLKKHLRTHTRHVLPQFPPLPHYDHLQHLQHVQQLQHLHHFQQMQQLQLHLPLIPFSHDRKTL